MENKIDQLFREKLENYSIIPGASAWDRVMGNVNHSEIHRTPWRFSFVSKLAAGIGFLGLLVGLMSDTNTIEKTGMNLISITQIPNPLADQCIETKKPQSKNLIANKSHNDSELKNTTRSNHLPEPILKSVVVKPPSPKSEKESMEISSEPLVVILAVEKPKEIKTMVIVYSLPPVQTKADDEIEEPSTLKKVIQFAQDVKGGETTLASVKLWKNNPFDFEVPENNQSKNN